MRPQPSQRLVFLEVSKVRSYHSTLMDGMVRGYEAAGLASRFGRPVLYAEQSFFGHLSDEARAAVEYRSIPVIDQDTRRWVAKSLLEAWVVLRCLIALQRGELLFVTTIMPSAMILVELMTWVLPRRQVVILQHGELDGAFQKEKQRLGSFGFYLLLWFRMRRLHAGTRVAVLDYFIAEEIQRRFPGSVTLDALHVIPLPMVPLARAGEREPGALRCCFIGFDSPSKGYSVFARLGAAYPDLDFRVIGGGQDRHYHEPAGRTISSTAEFLDALARCDVAIMPYVAGYDCSLSAAATDAVACGLHLLATERGCFEALATAFGAGGVTLCDGESGMRDVLSTPAWRSTVLAGRADRIEKVEHSHYALPSVGRHLARMIEGRGYNAAFPSHGDER